METGPAPELARAEELGDYQGVVAGVRALAAGHPGVLADPWVAGWLGRRYRQNFLSAAANDPVAVAHAGRPLGMGLFDDRSERARLFARYFRGADPRESGVSMPPPVVPSMGAVTLVFCPGLLTGLLPQLAFQQVFPRLTAAYGLPVRCVDAHPLRSSAANVADVLAVLDDGLGQRPDGTPLDQPEPVGDFVLLGYSKGAVDALTTLVRHPRLAPRCRAVVSWAGALGGSYVADDIHRRITALPVPDNPFDGTFGAVLRRIAPVVRLENITRRYDEYDLKPALYDLTTPPRQAFLAEQHDALAALDIPIVTVTGATRLHEVPYFQSTAYIELAKVDPDNDMQLTQAQARLPVLSAHLGTHHAHHWDMAYEAFPITQRVGSPNLDHGFARYAAVEATVLTLGELGLFDPR